MKLQQTNFISYFYKRNHHFKSVVYLCGIFLCIIELISITQELNWQKYKFLAKPLLYKHKFSAVM